MKIKTHFNALRYLTIETVIIRRHLEVQGKLDFLFLPQFYLADNKAQEWNQYKELGFNKIFIIRLLNFSILIVVIPLSRYRISRILEIRSINSHRQPSLQIHSKRCRITINSPISHNNKQQSYTTMAKIHL